MFDEGEKEETTEKNVCRRHVEGRKETWRRKSVYVACHVEEVKKKK